MQVDITHGGQFWRTELAVPTLMGSAKYAWWAEKSNSTSQGHFQEDGCPVSNVSQPEDLS